MKVKSKSFWGLCTRDPTQNVWVSIDVNCCDLPNSMMPKQIRIADVTKNSGFMS